jgi:hypothetical protein
MSNLQAKFASAFFAGILACLLLSTVSDSAARAADDCLSEPNGQTSQGKHWYYRIERGTGRHCWYQRGEDEKPARAAASDSTPTEPVPPRVVQTAPTRSLADARAEWPARPPVTQEAGPAAAPGAPPTSDVTATAPADSTLQAPASAPWPDLSRALPSLGPPPQTTAAAAADQPTDATVMAAAVPPPPAQAVMPTGRNMGSLQKLLLVAFGALLLSGLTGSAVYRLAGVRRRARMRRDRWPQRKPLQSKPQQIASDVAMAPWAPPDMPDTQKAALPRGRAQKMIEMDDVERDKSPSERVERIEDYLARLTRQLEAEMEAPRPERQRAAS